MIDYDNEDNPSEVLFHLEGGPWAGGLIALGDDPTTMVFRLGAWRGRYTVQPLRTYPRTVMSCTARWQDVPREAAA